MLFLFILCFIMWRIWSFVLSRFRRFLSWVDFWLLMSMLVLIICSIWRSSLMLLIVFFVIYWKSFGGVLL